MKVLVCGGRDYDNKELVNDVLLQVYRDMCFTTIVQGGARGADRLAKDWAILNGIPVEEYKPDWATFGKAAGIVRNQEMLDESEAQVVVAFPGGNGTFDMMRRAQQKPGVELIVVKDSSYGKYPKDEPTPRRGL